MRKVIEAQSRDREKKDRPHFARIARPAQTGELAEPTRLAFFKRLLHTDLSHTQRFGLKGRFCQPRPDAWAANSILVLTLKGSFIWHQSQTYRSSNSISYRRNHSRNLS
jgi:hypothetical protein